MSVVKIVSAEEKHDGDVAFILVENELVYSAGSDGKVKVRILKGFSIFTKLLDFFLM